MTIYRYEVVCADSVDRINHLLTRGWKPSRETPLSAPGNASPSVLVILKRDDTSPIAAAARIGEDIPAELLTEVPLLDGLTHEELSELVSIAEVRRHAAGEVIFEQGCPDSCLCIILSGNVELHLPAPGVEGVHIMQIGERDVFGESSFFSGGNHAACASAVSDVKLLIIPRDHFDELLQASRPVAWKIAMNAAGILGVRLQETDEWLGEILEQEEDARIAQSWQRFRESVGRGSFTSHRFFRT